MNELIKGALSRIFSISEQLKYIFVSREIKKNGPFIFTCTVSSMLRLDQAGNLTYFFLKVKHLSVLPETWRVVWYRYY